MSNINDLSNKVLGNPLLPEFIPPGRPTVGQGDLLVHNSNCELGNILPDLLDEVQEDEFLDVTTVHDPMARLPQRPDSNRISECVSLRLLKEYQCARNRPKDCKGKLYQIPQSIVHTYQHIKQLLEDSRVIQDQPTLVLTVSTAQDALPEARELHTAHGHQAMEFQEPDNREARQ
ncbi:unnamed protein product [Pleuronectes platessa]|uniref:Uncharacterized protein n=1 Tax=Pleuronectes platessa TaxID=8262 RepID=A0A9N7YWC3_PLEPL|nr:unnamed protein product [Pleuronectes platessa]